MPTFYEPIDIRDGHGEHHPVRCHYCAYHGEVREQCGREAIGQFYTDIENGGYFVVPLCEKHKEEYSCGEYPKDRVT